MLMPSIFGERFFDDFMDFPFRGVNSNNLMKTDIRDTDKTYELDIDLPGFKKEDIKAELKDGYLTINASTSRDNDEDGKYIRRERFAGSCTRTFYVGDGVAEEDIKAKFEDGILKLSVQKRDEQKTVDENRYIAIEG